MTQTDSEIHEASPLSIPLDSSEIEARVPEAEMPIMVVVNQKTNPELFEAAQKLHDATSMNPDGTFNESVFGGHPMVSLVDRSMEFHLFQAEFDQLTGKPSGGVAAPNQKFPAVDGMTPQDEQMAKSAARLAETAMNSTTLLRVEHGKNNDTSEPATLTVNMKGSGSDSFENLPVKIDRQLLKTGEAKYLLVKTYDKDRGENRYDIGVISHNPDSSISYQMLNQGERDMLLAQISRALKDGEALPQVHSLGILKETRMGKEVPTGAFIKPEPLSFVDAQRELKLPSQQKQPNEIIEATLKYL